jgi:hypothetical protein
MHLQPAPDLVDESATARAPFSAEQEVTDNGIACESPDKVATIFIEVTSAKGVDALYR